MSGSISRSETPKGDLAGFRKYGSKDLLSGFLVFLIALPLCLGISLACGYPAVAGIFTAIIGGIVSTFLSNSELTIKGPAAGLIVIAIGCITDCGFTGGQNIPADMHAYRMALAVGVAAAVVQILFGLLRVGVLGEYFPSSAVHGMLAAIGVIIMAKQFPIMLGASASGDPISLFLQIPQIVLRMNPAIALIGGISLLVLVVMPFFKDRWVGKIPAPMIVILVAIPLGIYFNLSTEHTSHWLSTNYLLGDKFLVRVPNNLFGAMTFPDFSALLELRAWKWVLMFSLIGSLESLLSSKAVDMLDPYGRKTNLDRDLVAVGVGNLLASLVGGLPMISEIVRSRANIDNGAKTRFSNLFHGVFLLLALALIPSWIHRIPLAALAAMLVYTGFRLASPREFLNVYKIGREQFLVYCGTIVAVLATDLLTGMAIGVGIELFIHLLHGAPLSALFRIRVDSKVDDEGAVVLSPKGAAAFTNWVTLKGHIEKEGLRQNRHVVVDLSRTVLVDHTVMERLHETEVAFSFTELRFSVSGLEDHRGLSAHPLAAQRRMSEIVVVQ